MNPLEEELSIGLNFLKGLRSYCKRKEIKATKNMTTKCQQVFKGFPINYSNKKETTAIYKWYSKTYLNYRLISNQYEVYLFIMH